MKKDNKTAITAFIWLIILIGIVVSMTYALQEIDTVAKKEKEQLVFGATYMTMDSPYYEALNFSMEEVIEANGDVLLVRDPIRNQEKQNEQILDFIDKGVDAIFVTPVDWVEISTVLRICKEKEVPVFVVDSPVYEDELVVSTIVSDNYNSGVLIAKDMMQKKDSANIAIVSERNINALESRVQGFLDTIEGKENYEVVSNRTQAWDLQSSMDVMQSVIESGQSFDVVIGANDTIVLGGLAALQKNKIEDEILLYGVDGSPDCKAMINEGYLEGSVAQFPYVLGRAAVNTAYEYLDGEIVKKEYVIETELITKRNLEKFDITGWQ